MVGNTKWSWLQGFTPAMATADNSTQLFLIYVYISDQANICDYNICDYYCLDIDIKPIMIYMYIYTYSVPGAHEGWNAITKHSSGTVMCSDV